MAKAIIKPEIDAFYTESSEQDRLKFGLGPLEWERNRDLISRHVEGQNQRILDNGGGPGVYAEWLSKMNHSVYLLDPVDKHITQAKKRAQKLKNPFEVCKGEAQNLPYKDDFFDLVILHGPLYHLQDENERLNALKEARRVTRKDGKILCFAINETASTLVGLLQGIIWQPDITKMCLEELQSGNHNAPKSMPGVLSGGFYHDPDRLKAEIEASGMECAEIFAVEGSVWLDKNYFETMGNPVKKAAMLEFLQKTETHASLRALSPHVMAVALKK